MDITELFDKISHYPEPENLDQAQELIDLQSQLINFLFQFKRQIKANVEKAVSDNGKLWGLLYDVTNEKNLLKHDNEILAKTILNNADFLMDKSKTIN
ncbi:hypothetical protein [Daejeonella sp. H1SJ63]|uniref:hypothetical protein n=1 Tax=Daejeonella sp. H1SJ63 TaxID=3034145 RepID=UPI0023EB6D26|nr:hypothetical protein [Daejeonella sp. H1SJ63]